jgi:hypothetical protein
MAKTRFYILLLMVQSVTALSQNYQAVQGSSYAGSLGVGSNPASIVNTPWPWDITILGVQEKHATNAVTIYKYSLLSSPAKSEYLFNPGNYSRYANENFNVNLFNARFALNRRSAIAFGMNIRGYTQIKAGPYNYIDSLESSREFFNLGNSNISLNGKMTSSSWAELFATYSRTIWDRAADRLNAGATLKISRGLSGAHAGVAGVRANRLVHNNEVYYEFETGQAQYGYSANYDRWDNDRSTSQNLRDFMSYTSGGVAMDVGIEYLLKEPGMDAWNEDTYFDYDWKFGISLLDLGFNQYKYGVNSRIMGGIRENISDSLFDSRLDGADNFAAFNDSLGTIVNTMRQIPGNFNIMNPARVVVNVDKYLFDAFYVNADLSVNLTPLAKKYLYVTDLNLLTVTPRWETRRLGFYMPFMVNAQGRFWVGSAFKAGPLLLGIHNWANVFSKNKMQNGGGYLALVIRPGKKITGRARADKRYECPE